MRKITILSLLLFYATIFFSCKKTSIESDTNDIVNSSNTNSFTYKGITHLTPIGFFSPKFTAEGLSGGTFEIFFPTSGVSFEKIKRTNSFGTFYDSYPKGIGNGVKLRFTSINKSNLPAGNYSYSYASVTPEVFGFITVYTGYDFTKLSGTIDRPSQSSKGNGQVIVKKNGEISTINYQFNFDNGEKVSGSFQGVLNTDWYSTFNNVW